MLELSVYEGIPHLLAPVVTDMRQAGNALNWCVAEMDKRYKLMSEFGVRNLAGFNQKLKESQEKGDAFNKSIFTRLKKIQNYLEELPLIVIVIDELADLMMTMGKKIEAANCKTCTESKSIWYTFNFGHTKAFS